MSALAPVEVFDRVGRGGYRVKARALAAALSLLITGACDGGGDSDDASRERSATSTTASAEQAMLRQFDNVQKRQWARHWEELHPAQQAFVAKDQFIRCSDQLSLSIESVNVVRSFEDRVTVPGTTLQADSVAIAAQVKVRIGQLATDFERTFHEFEVDGEWRWAITDPEPYKAGRCPLG